MWPPDDDEATELLMRLRPIKFQWKIGEDGGYDERGTPQGRIDRGFVAQELYEVDPNVVMPGRGTWDEHLIHKQSTDERDAAQALYDDWERRQAAHESRAHETLATLFMEPPPPKPPEVDPIDPFEPWQTDHSLLVPHLTAALQAMVRKVDALTARVAELEAR